VWQYADGGYSGSVAKNDALKKKLYENRASFSRTKNYKRMTNS